MSTAWKTENIAAVTTMMRLWRDENNALLRQKLSQESMRTDDALLEAIIRQGCDEGVFDTGHPHEAAIIITGMGLHLADAIIDAIDADGVGRDGHRRIACPGRAVRLHRGVRADPGGTGGFADGRESKPVAP